MVLDEGENEEGIPKQNEKNKLKLNALSPHAFMLLWLGAVLTTPWKPLLSGYHLARFAGEHIDFAQLFYVGVFGKGGRPNG